MKEKMINKSKAVKAMADFISSGEVWTKLKDLLAENEKLKTELKKMDERMSEVIYRATGGRLCYSTYTLDAIEQAFQDQLEILSDRKMEELREENKKLKEIINNMRYPHCADCSQILNSKGKCTGDCTFDCKRKANEQNDN